MNRTWADSFWRQKTTLFGHDSLPQPSQREPLRQGLRIPSNIPLVGVGERGVSQVLAAEGPEIFNLLQTENGPCSVARRFEAEEVSTVDVLQPERRPGIGSFGGNLHIAQLQVADVADKQS